ncbi:hypothetical protein HWV62_19903 [Athelia sp. TMB]|nr:hypothetical protein HWV62_19903 [Athelia sp. TMB]
MGLPPDICKAIENGNSDIVSLTIKGNTDEEAVLCTSNKTYAVRSVILSNAVLVVTRPRDWDVASDAIDIRDECHEIIELLPAVPRIHKLIGMLRGTEYDDAEEELGMDIDDADKPNKRGKITYADAQREIQASETELNAALKDKHILNLGGSLRPISPGYLCTILELVLNTLITLGLSYKSAPAGELVDALADEHEISRQVSEQVIGWFGVITHGRWKMCVDDVDVPITEEAFIKRWSDAVGDTFQSAVSLELLSGNYLSNPSSSFDPSPALTYFPASELPLEHPARFADLFLMRSRWRGPEIAPFLTDCAVDSKERDKLLLKYARATTENKEVFYTARAKYNG